MSKIAEVKVWIEYDEADDLFNGTYKAINDLPGVIETEFMDSYDG